MAVPGKTSKYAVLITNWTFGTPRDVPVGNTARCAWWSIDGTGPQQSHDAWRKAFGSFQWDDLLDDRACMLVFGNVADDLLVRTRLASYAYILNRPPINSGGVLWMAAGVADATCQPSSLDSWDHLPTLFLPWFIQKPAFAPSLLTFQANIWIDDWCRDFAVLDSARGDSWLISPPVEMALLSFMDASINAALDFRMPALVRTIESLVAVPQGPRQKATFVDRASRFAQTVHAHPAFKTTGRTILQVLSQLYQLRSDAVHGKWPLRDMRDTGREDEVALLDFVAETIARVIIKWSLRHRDVFSGYKTRAAIEDAWHNETIPLP